MKLVDKADALRLLEAYKQTLPSSECLPCALAKSDAAVQMLASNAHGIVILNRFAQRRGHLMVIARVHVEHVHELVQPARISSSANARTVPRSGSPGAFALSFQATNSESSLPAAAGLCAGITFSDPTSVLTLS